MRRAAVHASKSDRPFPTPKRSVSDRPLCAHSSVGMNFLKPDAPSGVCDYGSV